MADNITVTPEEAKKFANADFAPPNLINTPNEDEEDPDELEAIYRRQSRRPFNSRATHAPDDDDEEWADEDEDEDED